jgi:hypothetical protein
MFHFAYLDPSTGSLFVQAFIGSVAGAGFVFRKTINRVARRIAAGRSADTETNRD